MISSWKDDDVTNRNYDNDVVNIALIVPYTIFIIDYNLIDSFIELIKPSKPYFEPTFHKIENNKELMEVIFSTKRNRDSCKYVKINLEESSFNTLALQTFIAMAEFNKIYIFLDKIPMGLEIKGHVYMISDKLFEKSLMLENTGFYIKPMNIV